MATVYAGQILRLDLTTGAQRVQPIDDADVRHYLLGSGLAAHLYYREMDPRLDPLDPASPLLAFGGDRSPSGGGAAPTATFSGGPAGRGLVGPGQWGDVRSAAQRCKLG